MKYTISSHFTHCGFRGFTYGLYLTLHAVMQICTTPNFSDTPTAETAPSFSQGNEVRLTKPLTNQYQIKTTKSEYSV